MNIESTLKSIALKAIESLYKLNITNIEIQPTRTDFEGDLTIVVFPILKFIKTSPIELANSLGNYIVDNEKAFTSFNVVSGFLNIVVSDNYYLSHFNSIKDKDDFGFIKSSSDDCTMVEYSSPNTNKPLHLGHIRNNLLGYSVAQILKASGRNVLKTQIINDRGIHICKSMVAWVKFGSGETPESTSLKGDKLVGKYYVLFDKEYKNQVKSLEENGSSEEDAKKNAPILIEAQKMLLKWEAGDKDVVDLWKKMNQWVYKGFEQTYKSLGVDFDNYYYESDTYLLGKEFIKQGLSKDVFFKKEDGSIWCDLTDDGLDEKIVLRSDGTAVYMTQDIGTAIQRVKDYPNITSMIYTVGNEQDYHFKVLFLILKKLGFKWSESLHHLSYGMVDLPSGKMKSREGTVVDADDLLVEMTSTARDISSELGKLEDLSDKEKNNVYKTIGQGALKYFILKVDPKKRILFDPKESVDFQGNTGPFIQYSYVRIQAILRKVDIVSTQNYNGKLDPKEKELIKQLLDFPLAIQNAANTQSPALIANYIYDLVRGFNSFYQSLPILKTSFEDRKVFRLQLSKSVSYTIKNALNLLGIGVVQRM
ncbi:arginine--tRNA ligase [Flavobacteriaceae bacterium]|nr:arginine--tRNA ligase [Flavobacteriaceae bacterium]MDC1492607.1 arginine--tRNA ligase [Flavobacteriaceae bacterium]